MKDELARINGVGDVFMFGNRDYAMRVWLDPDKMTDLNLVPGEVVDAIRKQNVQVAAGQIGQPPVPRGQNRQLVVNTQGRLKTEQQFKDIVVKTGPKGEALVRLGDVARVELGAKSYDSSSALDNRPAVGLPVFQLPGGERLQHRPRHQGEDEAAPRRRRTGRRASSTTSSTTRPSSSGRA